MVKSILIFGGTFDPVHFGHEAFLKSAYSTVMPSETLIVPTSVPPHKHEAYSSSEMRMQMSETLCALVPNAKLYTYELEKDGKSYTIDTIDEIIKNNFGAQLYLCVGSDMLLYFRKWHRWDEIIKKVILVVQNRQDADSAKTLLQAQSLSKEGARVVFTNSQPLALSSTELRCKVANGEDITKYVNLKVREIIEVNRLYI